MSISGSAWYFLVDRHGVVIACDAAVATPGIAPAERLELRDILEPQAADELLERLAAGEVEISCSTTLSERLAERPGSIVHVQVRRLVGQAGPVALVIVHCGQQDSARDALTGLPDRRALSPRVESWKASAQGRVAYAVLFIDLDSFKQINDDHGHAVGDQVLTTVAGRLAHCVREGDLVVRYGGDEFVMLLKDVDDQREVQPVIDRIRRCLAEPIRLASAQFEVSGTVGVAVVDRPEVTIEQALEAADRDMYAQKRRPTK